MTQHNKTTQQHDDNPQHNMEGRDHKRSASGGIMGYIMNLISSPSKKGQKFVIVIYDFHTNLLIFKVVEENNRQDIESTNSLENQNIGGKIILLSQLI